MFTNLCRRVGPRGARPPRRFRPEVLPLEERAVPSVTLVNEVEGNNAPAQATALPTAGGLVIASGAIQAPGDVDYYSFTTPAGPFSSQVWAFVDTGGNQSPGATSRSAKLTLFDVNGTTVREQDVHDGTATGGGGTVVTHSPLIAEAPLSAGATYFLRVEGNDGTGVISPYKLFVRLTGGWHDESESNNTPALADDATIPGYPVVSGSISPDDVDYYKFTARAGDNLFLAADGLPRRDLSTGPDLELTLIGSGGVTSLLTADASASTTSSASPASEGFDYVVPATGTYYALVREFSTSTGNYHLLVTGNNEPGAFQFGAPSYSAGEGSAATLTVNRVAGSTGTVSVNYAVSGGAATAGADFTPVAGTLTFAAGEVSKTITIPISRDALLEGSENFVVTLSNPTGGATVGAGGSAVVTILDDPPPLTDVTPLVGVARGRVRFNPGTRHFRQRVTLHNLSGQVLPGPLWLVLDGLPRKVRLRNANGMSLAHGTPGSPFAVINLSGDGLAPGGSVGLVLDFANPRLRRIRYTPLVLEGLGLL
jgi:hypothetical protein